MAIVLYCYLKINRYHRAKWSQFYIIRHRLWSDLHLKSRQVDLHCTYLLLRIKQKKKEKPKSGKKAKKEQKNIKGKTLQDKRNGSSIWIRRREDKSWIQQENGKLETQELKANDVAVGDEKFFSVSYNQCSIQRITTDEEHQQELD